MAGIRFFSPGTGFTRRNSQWEALYFGLKGESDGSETPKIGTLEFCLGPALYFSNAAY